MASARGICTRIMHGAAACALATLLTGGLAAAADPSPNPRDLEGMWQDYAKPGETPLTLDALLIGVDLPYKAEGQNVAADHMKYFQMGHSIASAHLMCRPTGVQGITAPKAVVLIMQTPEKLILVSQEDREVRHIYMNQEHPKDLTPTYSGHSVGRWEGDTLVIDTIGFNGRGQLDEVGNPNSNQLHLIERISKSKDGGLLTNEITIDDPVYYSKPFVITRVWQPAPGGRLYDYDCAQNPRSDDFENLTFQDDWFAPTCVRPVTNQVAAEKVVCTAPKTKSPK